MKRLWLLRHAKSSWDEPGLPDRLRPLAPRGRKATKRLTRYFAANPIAPELVLCSPAIRATQTWEGVKRGLPAETRVEVDDAIYGADADDLLERLRHVPAELDSVLVIGHNPGLGDLAQQLAGAGDPAMRNRLATRFPTAALAGLRLPAEWRKLRWGKATLDIYVEPRDL